MSRSALPFILYAALLAGCASQAPKAIRTEPPGSPTVAQVRADPQRWMGAQVRWGGTIASVENKGQETWVEVVSRDLWDEGRPMDNDRTGGRFLARIPGFLDPAIYAKERQLTVAGTVAGSLTRPIGQYPYRFPVVRADASYLWEPLPPPRPWYHDPFWYDDPWYPYMYPRSWDYPYFR